MNNKEPNPLRWVVALMLFCLATASHAQPSTTPTSGTISLTGTTLADKNVRDALKWLKEHGAEEQARKIEKLIEAGELKWDGAQSANGSTSPGGTVTLSGGRVGVLGRFQLDFLARGELKEIIGLAMTMYHEQVHVDEHSGAIGACVRATSNMREFVGKTPHEIEAWTQTLRLGIGWLEDLLDTVKQTETRSTRLEAMQQVETMAEVLVSLIGSYEELKFYGEDAASQRQWIALKKDLSKMISEMRDDLAALTESSRRKACYDACSDEYLAAQDARNKLNEARGVEKARQRALERLKERRANAEQDLSKAQEKIARFTRQLGQAGSKQERDLIKGFLFGAIDDKDAGEERLEKMPSIAPAQARLAEASKTVKAAMAVYRAAWGRWRACLKRCLQTAVDKDELNAEQLPNGYGVENGTVVRNPQKYQRKHRIRLSFDSARWRQTLQRLKGLLPVAMVTDESGCLNNGQPAFYPTQGVPVSYLGGNFALVSTDAPNWCSFGAAATTLLPIAYQPETAIDDAISDSAVTDIGPESLPDPDAVLESIDEQLANATNEVMGTGTSAAEAVLQVNDAAGAALAGQPVKLFDQRVFGLPPPDANGLGSAFADFGQGVGPMQGITNAMGQVQINIPPGVPNLKENMALQMTVPSAGFDSLNLQFGDNLDLDTVTQALPEQIQGTVSQSFTIANTPWVSLQFPTSRADDISAALNGLPGLIDFEPNLCRTKQQADQELSTGGDPLFERRGSSDQPGTWNQDYDDQWAIRRVGVPRAWRRTQSSEPVVVAVIDTGLDWYHEDIDQQRLWRNPKELPGNNVDDDGNGYIDDVIGWDFVANTGGPWDHDGHGTLVTGIIAAATNNGLGIAGVSPTARIMVLRALNTFGNTRASYVAEAIVYAVDHGAKIINLSAGGQGVTKIERQAIDYATEHHVLVVVASGNEGVDVNDYGIAGDPRVLTVGATDQNDERAAFSNWGDSIDLAAPGVDVLSLRARYTDTMRDIPGVSYQPGDNYVGIDRRYYRANGTSFAAPVVAGVAALILAERPTLDAATVARILKQSAIDTGIAGRDQYTGYGVVNAPAALATAPDYFIEAAIHGVAVVEKDGALLLSVQGTADANLFAGAWVEMAMATKPQEFRRVADALKGSVRDGVLAMIPVDALQGAGQWILRLRTEHKNGQVREARYELNVQ